MVLPGSGLSAGSLGGSFPCLPTRLLRDVRYSHSVGCYTMSGTRIAYDAADSVCCYTLYAMSGTGIAYDATLVLCDVRYIPRLFVPYYELSCYAYAIRFLLSCHAVAKRCPAQNNVGKEDTVATEDKEEEEDEDADDDDEEEEETEEETEEEEEEEGSKKHMRARERKGRGGRGGKSMGVTVGGRERGREGELEGGREGGGERGRGRSRVPATEGSNPPIVLRDCYVR
eukprot:3023431-Rhodomonas_salina.2